MAHIKAVCANPSIDATLIQTEDLLALCDAASKAVEAPADVRGVAKLEAKTLVTSFIAMGFMEDNHAVSAEMFIENVLACILATHGTAQRAAGVEAAAQEVETMRAKVLDMGRVKVSTAWCASMLKALAASIRPDDGDAK